MRTAFSSLFLPFAGWLAALQATSIRVTTIDDTARIIGIAGVIGTLTVLVYRLGVWRQEMENTRNNVVAELKSYHEDAANTFSRLEQRLQAIEARITTASNSR